MNHFSYPLTIVQINIFEEPQNIFFPIVIPDPKLSNQPSRIFNPRVPPPPSLCLSQMLRQFSTWRLNHYFLKVINQLHETTCIPSYAELVSHMSKMSSAADCRVSELITPDYCWLWFFFLYELSLPWL